MADNKLDQSINKGLQSAKNALAEKMVLMAHKDAEQVKQETVYNVVFTGIFTKDEKMVVAAMAKFFKQGQEATKRLLKAGRVVKSYDNKMAADKLVKMLNGIGLSCKVESEILGGENKEATLLQKAAFKLDETNVPLLHIPKISEISWKIWLVLVLCLAGAAGAGVWIYQRPPVVQGNSFVTYEASVQKVIDHAPAEQRDSIKVAVDFLTGAEFEYRKRNTSGGNEQVAANMAYGSISGMNSDQIIAAAEVALEVKRKGFRDEIADVRKTIVDAQAAMAQLATSNVELNKMVVSSPQFAWAQGDTPQMSLKVINNTGETIGRLYFQGYLYDAGGKLLATAPFTYGTAFGIRPQDSKNVTIFTQTGDAWSLPEIKATWQSVVLKATLENAENMNGKLIGVDLRPNRKKIADLEAQINKFETELEKIKL